MASIPSALALSRALALCLLLGGCGGKAPENEPGVGKAGSGRPPEIPADARQTYFARVELEGGPFAPGTKVAFPVDAAHATVEWLSNGLRLSIVDPSRRGGHEAFPWGLWLFADGVPGEGATLRARTGTQLTLDGTSYAPAEDTDAHATATRHPLQATLHILEYNTRDRVMEGEWHGTFVSPDGRTSIRLSGELRLPLAPAAE